MGKHLAYSLTLQMGKQPILPFRQTEHIATLREVVESDMVLISDFH
jgi:hypothetical protein